MFTKIYSNSIWIKLEGVYAIGCSYGHFVEHLLNFSQFAPHVGLSKLKPTLNSKRECWSSTRLHIRWSKRHIWEGFLEFLSGYPYLEAFLIPIDPAQKVGELCLVLTVRSRLMTGQFVRPDAHTYLTLAIGPQNANLRWNAPNPVMVNHKSRRQAWLWHWWTRWGGRLTGTEHYEFNQMVQTPQSHIVLIIKAPLLYMTQIHSLSNKRALHTSCTRLFYNRSVWSLINETLRLFNYFSCWTFNISFALELARVS